jgi:hypothetical protein
VQVSASSMELKLCYSIHFADTIAGWKMLEQLVSQDSVQLEGEI